MNVLDGKNDDTKWQEARQILCFYINKMGVFYWQMLERNGYEAEVAASRRAFAEGDRKGALDAISERMIRDLQCIGRIDEVREQLRERAALGADLQMIYMPRGDVASTAKQLEELIAQKLAHANRANHCRPRRPAPSAGRGRAPWRSRVPR